MREPGQPGIGICLATVKQVSEESVEARTSLRNIRPLPAVCFCMNSWTQQVSRHSVAIVSLIVALSSLAYNTWRNEQTEANRNVRTAGIELLLALGELERVVFLRHYDKDQDRGNPRSGWAYALTIADLATLTDKPAIQSSQALLAAWRENWDGLGVDDNAADVISEHIDRQRRDMLAVLATLD